MQKITPCLWFNDQAEEAANFYVSIFSGRGGKNSKILHLARYGEAGAQASGRPKGSVMTVTFQLEGQDFMGLNGGPIFKFNPSISFHVKCQTKDEVDAMWEKLADEGTALMELGEYPFSERYGWIQDRYGLSWQLILTGESEIKQKIIPILMFVGKVCGKAEEAVNSYVSVFQNAKVNNIFRYAKREEPNKERTVKYAHFTLEGQELGAMDSALEHKFAFNEAISLMVNCKTQKEVDYFGEKLSQGGEEGPCGWLKDKYGLSWQIVPTALGEMMQDKDLQKSERVMQAMLQMKKIDIEKLRQAREWK